MKKKIVQCTHGRILYMLTAYHSIKSSISDNLFQQTKAWTSVDLIKIYLRETLLLKSAPYLPTNCITALTVTKGTLKFGLLAGSQQSYAFCRSSAWLNTGSKKVFMGFGSSAMYMRTHFMEHVYEWTYLYVGGNNIYTHVITIIDMPLTTACSSGVYKPENESNSNRR